MPQAVWTGTISFGLVSVPVRLYPATRRKDVRFHEIDRRSGERVRHQRVLPGEVWSEPASVPRPQSPALSSSAPQPQTAPVPRSEVVKGYEVAPDQYVTVEPEDLTELAPEQTRTIDIQQFVDIAAVDAIYFDRSYYAVPERDHARPYALLTQAMRETRRLAICWFVLRSKRHLAGVRADGNLMVLSTLFFADELIPRAGLEPEPMADLGKREREMARLLVDTLSGPFEPERYPDEYRSRVQALIKGRASKPRKSPAAIAGSGVDELMAALQASVKQARADAGSKSRPLTRRKRKTA